MSEESRKAWRRHVSVWRGVALDNMRNAYTGMENLIQQIPLADNRSDELRSIHRELIDLHKRLLRINLPLTGG